MSISPVYTAVAMDESANNSSITTTSSSNSSDFDVEASRPLLADEHDEQQQKQEDAEDVPAILSDRVFWNTIIPAFCGWNGGLLMQLISVRARAHLIIQWAHNASHRSINSSVVVVADGSTDLAETVQYYLYSIISHTDVIVCMALWLYFVVCLRNSRRRSGSSSFFHVGMCLLIGVICGSSAAWMSLDYLLGFPVPLSTMVLTLIANVSVCVMALRCQAIDDDVDDVDEIDEAKQ